MERCLCCYQPLHEGENDYHARCAKRFFGQASAPILPYTRKDINQLAQVVVESRTTGTGSILVDCGKCRYAPEELFARQREAWKVCAFPNL